VILGAQLLERYTQLFGEDWVQRDEGRVRLRQLEEYRSLVEEPGRFLMMTGEEVTTSWPGDTHYINVFNHVRAVPAQSVTGSSHDAMNATLRAAQVVGDDVLVSLNHPNFRYNATAEDIAASDLQSMEMHTALDCCNSYGDTWHAPAERIWDIILALRCRDGRGLIYGQASDDCHSYTDLNYASGRTAHPGRAWVMVQTEQLTESDLLAAMRRGSFYASTGVELAELRCDGEGIDLQIAVADDTSYTTRFIGTRRDADLTNEPVYDDHGRPMRATQRYGPQVGEVLAQVHGPSARYTFRGDEWYVRAEVISDTPHANPTRAMDVQRAWTQPIQPA
jgi:hypothetical protein